MDHYDFEIKKINNLNDIDRNKNIHYVYKDVHFLFKPHKLSNNLVVSFHGGIGGATTPVFRFFDYNFDNSSLLCFSDTILNHYQKKNKKYTFYWYLDTKKMKYTDIYK